MHDCCTSKYYVIFWQHTQSGNNMIGSTNLLVQWLPIKSWLLFLYEEAFYEITFKLAQHCISTNIVSNRYCSQYIIKCDTEQKNNCFIKTRIFIILTSTLCHSLRGFQGWLSWDLYKWRKSVLAHLGSYQPYWGLNIALWIIWNSPT